MLVSIAVVIKDSKNVTTLTNNFMKRIDKVKFPKDKLEVVFIVLNSPNEGMNVIRSRPLIRVVQLKGYSMGVALSFCVTKCHGDFFVLADLDTEITENQILSFGSNFRNVKNLAMINRNGVYAFRKLNVVFPDDLYDYKTYLILYSLINNYKIMGKWGRLHKKEVLRLLYKFDKISWWNKVKILLSMGG